MKLPVPGPAISRLLLFVLLTPFLFAQSQPSGSEIEPALASFGPPALTVRKHVDEVNLIVSVTDRKNHFVQDLTASDLSIFDNDKAQNALTFFQRQTELPLRIAILIDVSSSVAYQFALEKSSIGSFVKHVVRPVDSAVVFAFADQVKMVAPLSKSWKQVLSRVGKLKPSGNTALYDAVRSAAEFLEQDPRPARRIMILITDGEENSSKTTMDDAISEALKAEASITAVNVGDRLGDLGRRGAALLSQLADATGGSYLKASDSGCIDTAFANIKRELRSQYEIAYKPSNLEERSFHRVQVKGPERFRVRCRSGYYASKEKETMASRWESITNVEFGENAARKRDSAETVSTAGR
ncbi:MAG: VWA domain-containing protein [Terriglobales bacterium]